MTKIGLVLSVYIAMLSVCGKPTSFINQDFAFSSSDSILNNAYSWASQKAISYVGNSADPAGPWFEAALPEREAFCMRDVSHQCLGAEYLGLQDQNLNMMRLFVQNISENKDWCSYWEINRYKEPAPVDYRNDKEFWYNLPANFDVMQACYRLYKINGNKTYINDAVFLNFYRKTATDYIERWQLNPEQLLTRERFLNTPVPLDESDYFHIARGLPSYVESSPNLQMGSDLVAAIYGGLSAYANILELNGNMDSAQYFRAKANDYRILLDENWWNEANRTYYSYYTLDEKFEAGEPETFLLWFDVVENPDRINDVINSLSRKKYNIENSSYLPFLFYKYGRKDEAYKFLTYLADSNTDRRDYPEVSFGVIHGIFEGLMGIEVDCDKNEISVKANLTRHTEWAKIEKLHILSTLISVKHVGEKRTEVENAGKHSIMIRFNFPDTYNNIKINGKEQTIMKDATSKSIYCVEDCEPGKVIIAEAF